VIENVFFEHFPNVDEVIVAGGEFTWEVGVDLPIQMRVIEFESYMVAWWPDLSRKKYTSLEKVVFHRKFFTE